MKLTVVTTKAVYFGEYKLSLNRDQMNTKDCEQNEIVNHCQEEDHTFSWDKKMLLDIWLPRLPNLRQF